jgi:hypothetical protein
MPGTHERAQPRRAVCAVGWTALIRIEASPLADPSGMLALGNAPHASGGDLRRFSTNPHPLYCGIDRQARSLSVCRVNHAGAILVHRHRKAAPEPFLKAVAPDRDGLVVAVAGLYTWDLAG